MSKRLTFKEIDEIQKQGKSVFLESKTEDAVLRLAPDNKMYIKWPGGKESEVDPRKSNVAGMAFVSRAQITEEEYNNY